MTLNICQYISSECRRCPKDIKERDTKNAVSFKPPLTKCLYFYSLLIVYSIIFISFSSVLFFICLFMLILPFEGCSLFHENVTKKYHKNPEKRYYNYLKGHQEMVKKGKVKSK